MSGVAVAIYAAACASLAPGRAKHRTAHAGIMRRIVTEPERPRASDSVTIATLLINRSPRPFRYSRMCVYTDVYSVGPATPVRARTAAPRDTQNLADVRIICLGYAVMTLAPHRAAWISSARLPPFGAPGTYRVSVVYVYGNPELDEAEIRVR